MIDREKVIKALELEIKYGDTWQCALDCPYYGKTGGNCYTQVAMDALELLKEQKSEEDETGLSVTGEDIETLMNLIEKTLRKTHYQTVGCNNECIWLQTFIDAIELLKVQPRGRWVQLTGMAPPEYHGHKVCSLCNCFAPYDPIHPWKEILSKYCPGCGAKMEGEVDE